MWGAVFGIITWVSAYGYAAAYPKASDRLELARTLGTNAGVRAIFGLAHRLNTVGGFTAWRSSTTFIVLGGVWGLLFATKLLRGDEETGRSDLIYAGPVTRTSGLFALITGMAITLVWLFANVAMWLVPIALAYGYFSWTAALWLSFVSVMTATLFLAVGTLTSQLVGTRRAAAGLAGAFLAGAFVLRAVGGTVHGARWVTSISPIAWVDRLRPLTGTAYGALVPISLCVGACLAGARYLAVRRDVGGAILRSGDRAEPHTRLLSSPMGLALRLSRSTTAAWALGVALFAAVFGVVSSAVTDSFADNKSVSDIFNRLGASLSARGYVGVTFVMLGAVTGLVAAAFVSGGRAEEADGRLEHIASAPEPTWRWLLGRTLVGVASIVVVSVFAGVGGWIGVRASGGHIAMFDMVEAGLNLVAPGVLVLGIGTLVHGVAPRVASLSGYAVVAWSFLVEMIGSVVKFNHFVLDTSVIHHLAAAPAVNPRWATAAVMLAAGAAAALGGACALQRRDLVNA
ncbi:MAG: polyether ionophore transport system permease protein [Actinomycetota bacterium]